MVSSHTTSHWTSPATCYSWLRFVQASSLVGTSMKRHGVGGMLWIWLYTTLTIFLSAFSTSPERWILSLKWSVLSHGESKTCDSNRKMFYRTLRYLPVAINLIERWIIMFKINWIETGNRRCIYKQGLFTGYDVSHFATQYPGPKGRYPKWVVSSNPHCCFVILSLRCTCQINNDHWIVVYDEHGCLQDLLTF